MRFSPGKVVWVLAIAIAFGLGVGCSKAQEYTLGPGDVIAITVWGHGELSTVAPVRPDGKISLPLGEDLLVEGLSVTAVRDRVADVLREYLREPKVSVRVESFRTIRVQVLGAVRAPGYYQLPPDSGIIDAISRAGGTLEQSDLGRVTLTSVSQGEVRVLDVKRLLGGLEVDGPRLCDGDIIHIPEVRKASVLGEVRAPGSYVIDDDSTVVELLALAGGATSSGDLENAVLTNSSSSAPERTLDLHRLLANDAEAARYRIHPGDILYIPPKTEVVILGEVVRPGVYPIKRDTRVIDLIGRAGGLTSSAKPEEILITRATGEHVVVNLEQRSNADEDAEAVLQAGDVILVHRRRSMVSVLGEVRNPGAYPIEPGDKLLDLLAKAGGLTEDANTAEVSVTYTNDQGIPVSRQIDLGPLLNQTDTTGNIAINDSGLIVVPKIERQVLVLGEVNRPGYYLLHSGTRVLDVIAMAGDTTPDADLDNVVLTRTNPDGSIQSVTIPLSQVKEGLSLSDNVTVQPRDVVMVPKARTEVLILGGVNRPGSYRVESGDTVLDIIARAGGSTDSADLTRVAITNRKLEDQETIYIDISDSMTSGQPDRYPVQGGDTIVIPEIVNRVTVLGEVVRPGSYPLQPQERLLDVIAKAGGPTDRADLGNVKLTSTNEAARTIDLEHVMLSPTSVANVQLRAGDVVVISEARREVVVLGQVRNPGTYTYRESDTVLDALAMAGGVLPNADTTDVKLTRSVRGQREAKSLDVQAMQAGDPRTEIPVLQTGDTIYVPEANRNVLVLGAVNRPGAYPWKEQLSVLDLLALAGGARDTANLSEAVLTGRKDHFGQTLDLSAILENREPDRWQIQPGDTLYVPQAKQVLVLGEVNRPGSYYLPLGSTLLDALAAAGGPRDGANLEEITLTRQGDRENKISVFDYKVLTTTTTEGNVLVSGGDVVFVPEASRQVLVLGEVARPGLYPTTENMGLMEAIGAAGGPTDRAALQSVGLFRNGDLTAGSDFSMGKEKRLFVGNAEENPKIYGGDIVFVPETQRPNWSKIFSFVGGINLFKELLGW